MSEPRYVEELRDILCEWDPIGVLHGDSSWPRDEYDCLIGPVLGSLQRGADQLEVAAFLKGQLEGHFGLMPAPAPMEVATKIVAWYADYRAAG